MFWSLKGSLLSYQSLCSMVLDEVSIFWILLVWVHFTNPLSHMSHFVPRNRNRIEWIQSRLVIWVQRMWVWFSTFPLWRKLWSHRTRSEGCLLTSSLRGTYCLADQLGFDAMRSRRSWWMTLSLFCFVPWPFNWDSNWFRPQIRRTQVGVQRQVDVLGESGSDHHYPLEQPVVGRAKDQQLYYTFGQSVLLPVCFGGASES